MVNLYKENIEKGRVENTSVSQSHPSIQPAGLQRRRLSYNMVIMLYSIINYVRLYIMLKQLQAVGTAQGRDVASGKRIQEDNRENK